MNRPLGSWPITTPNQKADPPCTGCQKFLMNHFTDYVNSNLVPYEKTINCRNAERSEPEYNNLEIKKKPSRSCSIHHIWHIGKIRAIRMFMSNLSTCYDKTFNHSLRDRGYLPCAQGTRQRPVYTRQSVCRV